MTGYRSGEQPTRHPLQANFFPRGCPQKGLFCVLKNPGSKTLRLKITVIVFMIKTSVAFAALSLPTLGHGPATEGRITHTTLPVSALKDKYQAFVSTDA